MNNLRALFFSIVWMNISSLAGIEKLPEKYLVTYGNLQAINQVTQYYSFMCPYCLELYKKDFENLKKNHIDGQTVCYTFHPVPKDLLTVYAMECLAQLNPMQKKAFLEVMLEEINLEDTTYSLNLMLKAMELLGHPLPQLTQNEHFEKTDTFKAAYVFLAQEEGIMAVPIAEINGQLFAKEAPDLNFIEKHLKKGSASVQ